MAVLVLNVFIEKFLVVSFSLCKHSRQLMFNHLYGYENRYCAKYKLYCGILQDTFICVNVCQNIKIDGFQKRAFSSCMA